MLGRCTRLRIPQKPCAAGLFPRRPGSGIRALVQQSGQVGGVAGQSLDGAGDGLGRLLEVDVVLAAHRLAHPVGGAARGDGEADIGERLIQLGGDVVRAVLVAHHPTTATLPKVG